MLLQVRLLTLVTVFTVITRTIRAANDDLALLRHPCVAEQHQAPGHVTERCWQLDDHNHWTLTDG